MDKGNTIAGIQEPKSNKRLTRGGSTKGSIVFSFYTSLLPFHAPVQQLFVSLLSTTHCVVDKKKGYHSNAFSTFLLQVQIKRQKPIYTKSALILVSISVQHCATPGSTCFHVSSWHESHGCVCLLQVIKSR